MPKASESVSTVSASPSRELKDLTRLIQRAPGFPEVLAALKNGRSATIDGAWGSAGPLTAAGLGLHAPKTLLIVLAHVGDVDDFRDDVATFAGVMPEVFPAWEKLPREAGPGDEVFGRRLRVVRALRSGEPPRFVVAPIQAFLQPVPTAEVLARSSRRLRVGDSVPVEELTAWLIEKGMVRVEVVEVAGEFSVRGGILDVFPPDASDPIRVEFFGDEVESIREVDPLRGKALGSLDKYSIYPGSHYVTPQEQMRRAIAAVRDELRDRLDFFDKEGRFLEKQRLEQRTQYDLEMMEQMGFCQGIENYSRHLSGRVAGEPPPTLIDYFPKDFMLVIDESHQTVPQIGAMYRGDRARKETLVNYGFRLPSALDNRPLKFEEFEQHMRVALFVSATPSEYELSKSEGVFVEQIIRPTGLVDPKITIRPVTNQVDALLEEIRRRVKSNERVLVTTLTKRMAEDLTDYYRELGVKVKYLHSDIETLERIDILRELRQGVFDVLVGINLLREGLDLPEVSLVAILDADKEGFLRSARSLIQTIGRAARNVNGEVFMFADRTTAAMKQAIEETARRRTIQEAYNIAHDITPETVKKSMFDMGASSGQADYYAVPKRIDLGGAAESLDPEQLAERIEGLRLEMFAAAEQLEFEKATRLRDELQRLQKLGGAGELSAPSGAPPVTKRAAGAGKAAQKGVKGDAGGGRWGGRRR